MWAYLVVFLLILDLLIFVSLDTETKYKWWAWMPLGCLIYILIFKNYIS